MYWKTPYSARKNSWIQPFYLGLDQKLIGSVLHHPSKFQGNLFCIFWVINQPTNKMDMDEIVTSLVNWKMHNKSTCEKKSSEPSIIYSNMLTQPHFCSLLRTASCCHFPFDLRSFYELCTASANAIIERHTGSILRPNLLVESTTLHILGIHIGVHTKIHHCARITLAKSTQHPSWITNVILMAVCLLELIGIKLTLFSTSLTLTRPSVTKI